ncbi:hemolysin XhlA family protein [Dethiothermospora halolimnae]|uniref:hemolysin XhlA family protein n=1 Tax=Dethiothermospora halolimnae TaxID=3114390 RepID=UPI003CCBBC81
MESKVLNELLERVVRIETKIDGYNNLREKLDKTSSTANNNKEDIKEIKDTNKWLFRTFIGAIIASFIASFLMWK